MPPLRSSEFHDQRCFARLLAFVGRVGLRAFFRSSAEREMGVCYFDPRIERIIEEQIEAILAEEGKSLDSALMEQRSRRLPRRRFAGSHIEKQSNAASWNLNPLSAAARRRGQGALEAASTPSPGQFVADRPNAIWQIDHTIVDIVVVDEQYRRPMVGGAVLTIAIDVCTRMVAGFHLALEALRPAFLSACHVFFTPSTTKQLG